MNKLFRFAAVAAIAITLLAGVPSLQAQTIGDCPTVEISHDGGETWQECDNWGRFETRDSVTCYYDCPGAAQ